MQRFLNNIKKYFKYAIYSARADLKAEVAGSYLNWLWWILDPISFMLIYMFIAQVVFKSNVQYFPVFVFIGLTAWDYFNKNISASVKIVNNNRGIVSKIYIPKYILIMQKSFVLFFKMLISWALIFILMLLFKVPLTLNILYIIPIMIVLYLVTFGCCTILLHFGIFVEDLANIVQIVLKLAFYLSGIFYQMSRIPAPYGPLLSRLNPIAFIINSFRTVLLNSTHPSFIWLGFWAIMGVVLTTIGITIIHKYENSYAKVI